MVAGGSVGKCSVSIVRSRFFSALILSLGNPMVPLPLNVKLPELNISCMLLLADLLLYICSETPLS